MPQDIARRNIMGGINMKNKTQNKSIGINEEKTKDSLLEVYE